MPNIFLEYAQDMPKTYSRYAQDRPKIYPKYAQDEPAKGVPKICPIYSQNMLKIWIWLNMPIFGSQRSEQPKYVQFGQKIKILDLNQVSYPFNKYRIQFYKKNVWKQCHWRGGGGGGWRHMSNVLNLCHFFYYLPKLETWRNGVRQEGRTINWEVDIRR